ncbi:UNVERIFIED_CONTAM: hypothetical protein FKN15_005687 [Acipenser sinensis]
MYLFGVMTASLSQSSRSLGNMLGFRIHAVHLFGLTWQLQPVETPLYENGVSKEGKGAETMETTFSPIGGLGPDKPDRSERGGKTVFQRGRAIDRGEVDIGTKVMQTIPPGLFWRFHVTIHHPMYLKFNISLARDSLLGIYGRRNIPPTHTQETGFIEYMDLGTWHLAFYNDGKKMEQVFVLTTAIDSCPVLCSGNGEYEKGHCVCHSDWKGPECDIPEDQCIDPTCDDHGSCINGVCICIPGYKGNSCEQVDFSAVAINLNALASSTEHLYAGFDLVAVGGISVTLIFERAPFITERRTLWLPWNQFVVVDKVIMTRVETAELTCDVSNFISPYPIVLPSPLTIFAGSCSERGPAVPELQAVQEEITIPGSFVKLSYLSTRTPGYKSLLRIILTHSLVPTGLTKVHLTAAIEGRLLQRWFPATPNLTFTFAWNKTDIYGQKVSGLTEAIVSVGYEYEACPDFIVWEKRTALLQGFEMDASNLGGWSLDKHHILNLQSGILHKGNGENIFISQQPPVITTVMGDGFHRSIPCPNCNGPVQGRKLFAPIAVACGPDSSVYVGDFNFVRRILPSGYAVTILELSTSPAHKYYLAVDPVNESLYLSDTSSRKILRVKSLTEPKDLAKNFEVVAGSGDQCLPFDQSHCGDGGKANEASLNNPRGKSTSASALLTGFKAFHSETCRRTLAFFCKG